ncbi:MAG TPA: hypothetical protein VGF70_02345 [Solirubrobacteraceae bacterium]|jgi:hypothetical protein
MRRLLVGALTAIGVAACGSTASHKQVQTAALTPEAPFIRTRLSGLVEVCGDPFPSWVRMKNLCTLQSGHVSILRAGREIAASPLHKGRFSFRVRPGMYTVIAWNGGNGPWRYVVSTRILRERPLYIIIPVI